MKTLLYSLTVLLLLAGAQVLPAQEAMPAAPPAPVTVEPPAAVPPGDGEESLPPPGVPGTGVVTLDKQEDNLGATASEQGNITVDLNEVELFDVIKMFARLGNANIVMPASTNLQGRLVTTTIDNMPWKDALETILDEHDYMLVDPKGKQIYRVVPKPPAQLTVATIFLRYAQVRQVEPVIQGLLGGEGSLSTFPSRNALVIRSTDRKIAEIKNIIFGDPENPDDKGIDVLRDQVYIEAKFLELNDEAIQNIGVNWSVLSGYGMTIGSPTWDYSESRAWNDSRTAERDQQDLRHQLDGQHSAWDAFGVQNTAISGAAADSFPTTAGGVPARFSHDFIEKVNDNTLLISQGFTRDIADVRSAILTLDDFRLILSALKEMDGVTIVSNPKIIVANEEPAVIHIGETERPFVSSVTPGQQGIAPVVTYNPGEAVDLGVKLTVTPTVNTESNITVKIEPELTRFIKNAVAPNGQTYPIIGTKKISTLFCLESGKTVAIGGLTETVDRDVEKKIPILGDIPLLGKFFFSHSNKEKTQQETVIFVTVGLAEPGLMDPNVGLPEDAELVPRHVIRKNARLRETQAELETLKRAVDEETEQNLQKIRERLRSRR